jgi:hypothetical protein
MKSDDSCAKESRPDKNWKELSKQKDETSRFLSDEKSTTRLV